MGWDWRCGAEEGGYRPGSASGAGKGVEKGAQEAEGRRMMKVSSAFITAEGLIIGQFPLNCDDHLSIM